MEKLQPVHSGHNLLMKDILCFQEWLKHMEVGTNIGWDGQTIHMWRLEQRPACDQEEQYITLANLFTPAATDIKILTIQLLLVWIGKISESSGLNFDCVYFISKNSTIQTIKLSRLCANEWLSRCYHYLAIAIAATKHPINFDSRS